MSAVNEHPAPPVMLISRGLFDRLVTGHLATVFPGVEYDYATIGDTNYKALR